MINPTNNITSKKKKNPNTKLTKCPVWLGKIIETNKILKKVSLFPAISQQPNTYIIINKDGVLENRKRNRERDPPGHIGLISRNHPGITAEIQSHTY